MRTDFAFHNPLQIANFIFPCLVMALMKQFHDVDVTGSDKRPCAAFWYVGSEYVPGEYLHALQDKYEVLNYAFIRTFAGTGTREFQHENMAIELMLIDNKSVEDTSFITVQIKDYNLVFVIDFDKDYDEGYEGKPHAYIHVKKFNDNKPEAPEQVMEHYKNKIMNVCKPIISNSYFFMKDENDDITGLI